MYQFLSCLKTKGFFFGVSARRSTTCSVALLFARYGYKDVRREHHQTFEQLLIDSLEKFVRREAQERLLESDEDADTDTEEENSCSRVFVAPDGNVYSLGFPLLADYIRRPSTSSDGSQGDGTMQAGQDLERALSFIHKAKGSGVVYLLGHGGIRARKDSWFVKKLVINYLYMHF